MPKLEELHIKSLEYLDISQNFIENTEANKESYRKLRNELNFIEISDNPLQPAKTQISKAPLSSGKIYKVNKKPIQTVHHEHNKASLDSRYATACTPYKPVSNKKATPLLEELEELYQNRKVQSSHRTLNEGSSSKKKIDPSTSPLQMRFSSKTPEMKAQFMKQSQK